ncbi:zinc knuckle CX2CX4HX4C containing protein [Tanacetum coccineum]
MRMSREQIDGWSCVQGGFLPRATWTMFVQSDKIFLIDRRVDVSQEIGCTVNLVKVFRDSEGSEFYGTEIIVKLHGPSKFVVMKDIFEILPNVTCTNVFLENTLEKGLTNGTKNPQLDERVKLFPFFGTLVRTRGRAIDEVKDTKTLTVKGANVSIPRKIVETVSSRLANTLYGYFIGKRIAFPVVEYFVRNNWGKYGLTRIMMNSKGFFFFQFKTLKGLEDVLENGPWMIRKSPIILKKWNMSTRLCKDELSRIPVWVKIHDVPIQAFTEDGLSIIASKLGKPIMLDSYTSSMCIESWGRSSFARCLIEINAEDVLQDSLTIGIPCEDDGFSIETVSIEYEWKPPRCDLCKIFGHSHDCCPKKVLIPNAETSNVITPNVVNTSTVPTPLVQKTNDGFQTVGKKKKKKGKSKSNVVGPSIKQNVRYEPKASTSAPKKTTTNVGNVSNSSSLLKNMVNSPNQDNITSSNSFAALNKDIEDEEEVENVFDETANLFNSKTGGRSSFTAVD